jgi:hypothetical protein
MSEGGFTPRERKTKEADMADGADDRQRIRRLTERVSCAG